MVTMDVAILTLDGFNEIDSFVALHILGRVNEPGWRPLLVGTESTVTSMNGVSVTTQATVDDLPDMDAVLVGSGVRTREFAADQSFLGRIKVDPQRQLVGSQCSGALLLAGLGLLDGAPACTDLKTRPWLIDSGVTVLDQPFVANGNVATAGGCLSSQYLAAWAIARLTSIDRARAALEYVAPVGETERYVDHALAVVAPSLPTT